MAVGEIEHRDLSTQCPRIDVLYDLGEYYRLNHILIVPKDPGNIHYRAIQKWLEEGNEPDPLPEEVPPEPTRQDKLEEALECMIEITAAESLDEAVNPQTRARLIELYGELSEKKRKAEPSTRKAEPSTRKRVR